MSFSAGVFSINSSGQPVVTGTVISSTVFNALTADLATGLTTCVLKDGTQTATASVPFAVGLSANSLVDLSNASAGQIKFPATQNPSSNANTLDDYEEGTWTPEILFATPGDLNVAYSTQLGAYRKIGGLMVLTFNIVTSTFTFTTASGNLQLTGLPIVSVATYTHECAVRMSGVSKTGFTSITAQLGGAAQTLEFLAYKDTAATSAVTAADTPTGGTIVIYGTLSYMTA